MRRVPFALCLPFLLAISCWSSELKREAAAMHMTGLVAEGTNTKPAVPQPNEPAEPAALPQTGDCAAIMAEIAKYAPGCALEEQMAKKEGKTCEPINCPECGKLVEAQNAAETWGC